MSNELIPGTEAWIAQQEAIVKGAALRARSGFSIAPPGTHLGIIIASAPGGTGWRENPETGEHEPVPLCCLRVQLNARDLNGVCKRAFVDWWGLLSHMQRSNLTALLSELRVSVDQYTASMGACLIGRTVSVATENTTSASGKEYTRIKRISSPPDGSLCNPVDCPVAAGAPSRVPLFFLKGFSLNRRSDEPIEPVLFDLPTASAAIAKHFGIELPLGLPSGLAVPAIEGEPDPDDAPF